MVPREGAATPLDALDLPGGQGWQTAAGFTEAVLKAAILDGRLPAGTRLGQEELARRLGVSRMPVREALARLEAQALVETVPHRGAVVAAISAADAADLYAIRLALEPAAFGLSIPQMGADDWHRAATLITAMDDEQDAGRMGQLNRQFHVALYARAGHPRLLSLVLQHLAAFDRYLRFHLALQGPRGMRQDEHRAMLAAGRNGEAAEAVALLRHHITVAARDTAAFFEERAGRTDKGSERRR
jgi:DNA-binding GntR family transcriptional regulator